MHEVCTAAHTKGLSPLHENGCIACVILQSYELMIQHSQVLPPNRWVPNVKQTTPPTDKLKSETSSASNKLLAVQMTSRNAICFIY